MVGRVARIDFHERLYSLVKYLKPSQKVPGSNPEACYSAYVFCGFLRSLCWGFGRSNANTGQRLMWMDPMKHATVKQTVLAPYCSLLMFTVP